MSSQPLLNAGDPVQERLIRAEPRQPIGSRFTQTNAGAWPIAAGMWQRWAGPERWSVGVLERALREREERQRSVRLSDCAARLSHCSSACERVCVSACICVCSCVPAAAASLLHHLHLHRWIHSIGARSCSSVAVVMGCRLSGPWMGDGMGVSPVCV